MGCSASGCGSYSNARPSSRAWEVNVGIFVTKTINYTGCAQVSVQASGSMVPGAKSEFVFLGSNIPLKHFTVRTFLPPPVTEIAPAASFTA